VDRARLKEQCRMRLTPAANEHRRDRGNQPVSPKPPRLFALLEKIGRAALRGGRGNAERDLAAKGGWASSRLG
jgi:hypothetical protein